MKLGVPYQVVIDTNVFVAAARSRRGASFALLSTIRNGNWEMSVSSALLTEYEAQLKREFTRQGRSVELADRLLDFIARIAHRRQTYYLLRPELNDPGDDFILELAVAAQADFIVTFNVKDFSSALDYGVQPVRPADFLKLLKN